MLHLDVTGGTLTICRLAPDADVPDWSRGASFASITRTPDELSVVVAEGSVPPGVRAERGWRALVVRGPLEFSMTGVIASIARPLADAGIPLFVISTYDTDWILVRDHQLHEAIGVLRAAGHEVSS